ncbi:MAG: aminodeoxychorismate/anthranilate synthase component II [Rickettsiales bacterium]|nr:aminodeoxychorismate/anthranilate synthase component II [Rickettsiales bacterium]
MLILLDNYDSFTYNLVHYIEELGKKVQVFRNDEKSVEEILSLKPSGIVISPGPCDPDRAGISKDLIKQASNNNLPVLGVCLGHQAIGEVFGGKVIRAEIPMHGKISEITHNGKGLFENLPSPFKATRYHSLIIEKKSFPKDLQITAWCDDIIMGVQHISKPVFGVQFHPESIASEFGHDIIKNFLKNW